MQVLLIIAVLAGIIGGFLSGVYEGKRYPLLPGEHLPYVRLYTGVLLILIAVGIASFLAAFK